MAGDERKPGRDYYLRLKDVRDRLVWAAARVEGLNEEKKPEALASQNFDLSEVIGAIDHAADKLDAAIGDAQVRLAIEGEHFKAED